MSHSVPELRGDHDLKSASPVVCTCPCHADRQTDRERDGRTDGRESTHNAHPYGGGRNNFLLRNTLQLSRVASNNFRHIAYTRKTSVLYSRTL